MFDVVRGDGAADDVAAARREATAREGGKKTRCHSAEVSKDQLSFREEGEVEKVSLCRCFQKPTCI